MEEKAFRCHCGATYSVKQSLLRHQAQHRAEGGAQEEEEEVGDSAGAARHPRPIRGRPRKKPLPQRDAEAQVGRGGRHGRAKTGTKVEERRDGGETPELQHAVVYVRTDQLPLPGPERPLLLGSGRPGPAGTGQDLVQVLIAEGQEQCIMVHGEQPVGELLILQEDESGLCSVAQTVEINSV